MKPFLSFKFLSLAFMLMFSISTIIAQNPTPVAVDTTPVVAPATTAPFPDTTAAPEETKAKKEKDGFNSKLRFGIRGGGIISKTDFETANQTEEPLGKIGADLAILCAIPIGGGFFNLQPELHWMQKGYNIEDATSGEIITSTLNYLELPLLMRLNFGGSLRLFAFAGPSVGYLLNGELNTATTSEDATEYLKETEFNAHLGLGIGLGTFEFDIRYIAGLTEISDSSDLSDVKNSSYGAGITLKF